MAQCQTPAHSWAARARRLRDTACVTPLLVLRRRRRQGGGGCATAAGGTTARRAQTHKTHTTRGPRTDTPRAYNTRAADGTHCSGAALGRRSRAARAGPYAHSLASLLSQDASRRCSHLAAQHGGHGQRAAAPGSEAGGSGRQCSSHHGRRGQRVGARCGEERRRRQRGGGGGRDSGVCRRPRTAAAAAAASAATASPTHGTHAQRR